MAESETILKKENINPSAVSRKEMLREAFNENYNDLFYYGVKLSKSDEIARDCIQDMFIQFWTHDELVIQVRSLKAYLLKCLRRRIFLHLSRETKSKILNPVNDLKMTGSDSVEEEFIRSEHESILHDKLGKARETLTSRQQEILFLRYNLEYPYEQICEIMDIKYQSVRNLLSEAVKSLRDQLNQNTN